MIEYNDHRFGEDFFVLTSENCPATLSAFYGFFYDSNYIFIRSNPKILLDKYTAGVYVNLQVNDGKIIVQQDYLCSFGLYIYKVSGYWALSNSFYILARFLSDRVCLQKNEEYMELYEAAMVPYSVNETAIKEITELGQGQFIEIDIKTKYLIISKYHYNKATVNPYTKEGIEILDRWHKKYSRIIQNITSHNFYIICDLSGGFDSRAAASVLWKPDIFKDVYIYSPDDDIYKEDYKIASMIASQYGFRFRKPNPEYIKISSYRSILNSLNTKLYFHTELYFKSSYYLQPLFSLNGGGGEALRSYYNADAQTFIKRLTKNRPIAERCMTRTWNYIMDNYPEEIIESQKFYNYCRSKNHFGRSAVESFLCNMISIAPLLDPVLYDFNLTPQGFTNDRNSFFSLIYTRYLSEIAELPFDKGRSINKITREFVRNINNKYPYHDDNDNSPFSININARKKEEDIYLPSYVSTTAHFVDFYKTASLKDYICSSLGEECYNSALQAFDPAIYYGFTAITKLISKYLIEDLIKRKEGYDYTFSPLYNSTIQFHNIEYQMGGLKLNLIASPNKFSSGNENNRGERILETCIEKRKPSRLCSLFNKFKEKFSSTKSTPDIQTNPSATATINYDLIIRKSPFSRKINLLSSSNISLKINLYVENKFMNYCPFMIDIKKILITDIISHKIIYSAENIYCLYKRTLDILFSVRENSSTEIFIEWNINKLWLYDFITYHRYKFADLDCYLNSHPHIEGDNNSNQFNM